MENQALAYININGKITAQQDAALAVDNRAFRYGYGLFETMLVIDGSIQLEPYHWQRLFEGLSALNISLPKLYIQAWLQQQVLDTMHKNKLSDLCRVRLQISAGNGGLYDRDNATALLLIECFPLQQDTIMLNEHGLHIGIAEGLQKSPDSLANFKSCSALIYAMAAQQAQQHKWNDILIPNTAAHIIESSIANLFIIKDEHIYTPPLSDGCVAGVMRRHIIDQLAQQGINVIERSLVLEDLLAADELFLCNAIRRMRWVASLQDKTYGNAYTKSIYNKVFSTP